MLLGPPDEHAYINGLQETAQSVDVAILKRGDTLLKNLLNIVFFYTIVKYVVL